MNLIMCSSPGSKIFIRSSIRFFLLTAYIQISTVSERLSRTTQLVSTVHNIMNLVDSGHPVHSAVVDFFKTFDWVSRVLLIAKMKDLGSNTIIVILVWLNTTVIILPWILLLFDSFLTGRYQKVISNAASSGICKWHWVYHQDQCWVPYLDMKLFADDTLIFKNIDSSSDELHFQEDFLTCQKG